MTSITTQHYNLRYWINKSNIDDYGWKGLYANPNAIKMLENIN
jgi:hypothetical protein